MFYAPRVLYQATIGEHCKSYINQAVAMVLVTDKTFVQKRCILQEVIQLDIGAKLPYR